VTEILVQSLIAPSDRQRLTAISMAEMLQAENRSR